MKQGWECGGEKRGRGNEEWGWGGRAGGLVRKESRKTKIG